MYRLPLIFLILCTSLLFAQEVTPSINQDTTAVISDTLSADTTAQKSDIDAVVYSSAADSMIFKVRERELEIYGNGELKYKQTELKSSKILIDFETNQLEAFGVPDTADPDKLMNTPVLTEAGEVYEGNRINYDFRTQRGFISLASTETDGSIYGGNKVKKIETNTYFIEDGIYTTCTEDPSHFHFYAKQMKVILKEQVVAKWIWFHIAGVPFPIPIPFGAFPNESGRRSGLIAPAYGQRQNYGYYFSNFGYYWAISDYTDAKLTADYYTRGGYNLNGSFRYAKRYSLDGSVNLGYSNLHQGFRSDPDYDQQKNWSISMDHRQTINPTTSLNANLYFVSSKDYINNTSVNYNQLLSQDIRSNASFSKRWDESGASMSLNYSRTQQLSGQGNITELLPDLRFNKTQFYPFKKKGKVDPKSQSWYELMGFSYSGQFLNRRIKTGGNLHTRGGIQHTVSTSASPKVGYINISPNFNYSEKWYNKRSRLSEIVSPATGRDSIITEEVKELNAVRNFSTGVSANTKLYGIINANSMGIEAVRHTITPSVSYSYTPDFSSSFWGYYDEYVSTSGEIVKYNKFSNEVFGGAPSGEQQNINLNVGNVFEMKTMKDMTDTTSEAKKIELLRLDGSLGYNFAADSLNLSDLRLNYRTQIGEYLNFQGSSTYSFYDYAVINRNGLESKVKTNNFLLSEGKGLLKLTDFTFSLGSSISGEKLKGAESREDTLETDEISRTEYYALYREEPPDFNIPWDLSFNYIYSYSPLQAQKRSSVQVNANVSLSKTWKLSLSSGYDIFEREITAPQIRIFKDLHCWEMNITWRPLGFYRGYHFEIRIKAPQLQDIKVTRDRGQFSGR